MEELEQFEILWNKIREEARKTVNPISYNTFVENLVPTDTVNRKIVLKAETELTAKVVTGTLADLLRKAVVAANVGLNDFVVVVDGSSTYTLDEMPDAYEETTVMLDKRYTFDSFVAGTSNEFVFAAAKSVADAPGAGYNPLYIYGSTGLGKTHLLQAIANELAVKKPTLKVIYTTSENFLNEYIDMLSKKNKQDYETRFRNRYRNVDVLLIDDIQFWAGKHGVQEAFFHAFNELYAKNAQIVISSDCDAKDLTTLEERLRTRFQQGLTANILPPDAETKIAILKRKALEKKYILTDDVLAFLAKNTDNNVRTLEGRLNKVIFASKLHEQPISLSLAASALQEAINTDGAEQDNRTPEAIIRATCNYYSISEAALIGKNKRQDLVRARQVCTYLMCEMLSLPLVNVGKAMGGRDHTTVIYSRDKIAELIRVNDAVLKEVNDIKSAVLKL